MGKTDRRATKKADKAGGRAATTADKAGKENFDVAGKSREAEKPEIKLDAKASLPDDAAPGLEDSDSEPAAASRVPVGSRTDAVADASDDEVVHVRPSLSFQWTGDILGAGDTYTKVIVRKHPDQPHMFWIQTNTTTLSLRPRVRNARDFIFDATVTVLGSPIEGTSKIAVRLHENASEFRQLFDRSLKELGANQNASQLSSSSSSAVPSRAVSQFELNEDTAHLSILPPPSGWHSPVEEPCPDGSRDSVPVKRLKTTGHDTSKFEVRL